MPPKNCVDVQGSLAVPVLVPCETTSYTLRPVLPNRITPAVRSVVVLKLVAQWGEGFCGVWSIADSAPGNILKEMVLIKPSEHEEQYT
jgi:hypothetical protein